VRLRPLSLRSRLALLFALGTTVLLVVASLGLYLVLDHQLSMTVDQGLAARSTDLAELMQQAGGAIPDRDPFAQVIDSSGTVIDQSPTADIGAQAALTPEEVAGLGPAASFEREFELAGGRVRVLARQVTVDGRSLVLVVGSSLEDYDRTRERLVAVLVVSIPLLAGLLAGAGWLLAGAALRPVRRLTEEADAISITELRRRLPVPGTGDEIELLARTLNAMLERIEASVARERQFLDDASHELRTPLSILRGELELAVAEPGDPVEVEAALRSALDEADRLARLADDLLALARAQAGGLEPRPVAVELLGAVQHVVGVLAVPDGVTVTCTGPTTAVEADPDHVEQILFNLLTNAIRHARAAVTVRVGAGPDGTGELVVSDDGPGFPSSMLPIGFERFARADPARGPETGGTGLGLSICAAIARAHGGTIDAGNDPAGGAWVRVALPSAPGGDGPTSHH